MEPTRGKALKSILGIAVVLLLAFFALVAYYLWQIRYGNTAALIKEFKSDELTLDESQSKKTFPNDLPLIASQIAESAADRPTLGRVEAPVTIIAFIDFECPFCQKSYPIFKRVTEKYAPVVRVIFKHFPIATIHPHAMQAAYAATCAHEQGKFWPYYDRLFTEKTLDDASLLDHASATDISPSAFRTCIEDLRYTGVIEEDLQDAKNLHLRGTPTYIVNGVVVEGVTDETTWDKILLNALQ